MTIGVDASRAFLDQRTGIEEYSYQVISHLMDRLKGHEVILYVRRNQESEISKQGFVLPANWKIKIIKFPYLWTQAGLSLEMLFNPVHVLFVPAHTVPLIHAKNTIVTIHGLEYEFVPEAYSEWAKLYMRWSIKFSCRAARKIIAVSKNTKNDLENLCIKCLAAKLRLFMRDIKFMQLIRFSSKACKKFPNIFYLSDDWNKEKI